MADVGQGVGAALVGREVRRPVAPRRVAPGLQRQEGDLRRAEAIAQRVEQVEILQRIGADLGLGALDRAAFRRRDQLRRDLGLEDRVEHRRDLRIEVARGTRPTDQVLDQRLRHAGIDVVVRHLVADAIGAPAERQFRQVAGAEHDPVDMVGGTEQVVGAEARLHVLEGDVVDRLPAAVGMTEVGQHLPRRRADIQLMRRHADRRHQPVRIALGAVGRPEARHGIGDDVGARLAQQVHRLGRDDQRLRRVEPARDADDDALDPRRLQPLGQAGDLDVVGLVAILGEPPRVGRDEGEALDRPLEPDIAVGRVQPEGDGPEAGRRRGVAPVVVEGALPHAVLPQQVEVDIGDGDLRTARKAGGLRQQRAVLPDLRLAVPGDLGRGFAGAGGGIGIGGKAAGGLRLAEHPPRLRLADGDRAAADVEQHRRAGQRRGRTRRDRHPEILADLGVQDQAGDVFGFEQQRGAEGRHLAGDADIPRRRAIAGGDLPPFVELPIGRQVGLRHHAE